MDDQSNTIDNWYDVFDRRRKSLKERLNRAVAGNDVDELIEQEPSIIGTDHTYSVVPVTSVTNTTSNDNSGLEYLNAEEQNRLPSHIPLPEKELPPQNDDVTLPGPSIRDAKCKPIKISGSSAKNACQTVSLTIAVDSMTGFEYLHLLGDEEADIKYDDTTSDSIFSFSSLDSTECAKSQSTSIERKRRKASVRAISKIRRVCRSRSPMSPVRHRMVTRSSGICSRLRSNSGNISGQNVVAVRKSPTKEASWKMSPVVRLRKLNTLKITPVKSESPTKQRVVKEMKQNVDGEKVLAKSSKLMKTARTQARVVINHQQAKHTTKPNLTPIISNQILLPTLHGGGLKFSKITESRIPKKDTISISSKNDLSVLEKQKSAIGNAKTQETVPKNYKCHFDKCGVSFMKASARNAHVIMFHPWNCVKCDVDFTTPLEKYKHFQAFPNNTTHCQLCLYSSKTKKTMEHHKLTDEHIFAVMDANDIQNCDPLDDDVIYSTPPYSSPIDDEVDLSFVLQSSPATSIVVPNVLFTPPNVMPPRVGMPNVPDLPRAEQALPSIVTAINLPTLQLDNQTGVYEVVGNEQTYKELITNFSPNSRLFADNQLSEIRESCLPVAMVSSMGPGISEEGEQLALDRIGRGEDLIEQENERMSSGHVQLVESNYIGTDNSYFEFDSGIDMDYGYSTSTHDIIPFDDENEQSFVGINHLTTPISSPRSISQILSTPSVNEEDNANEFNHLDKELYDDSSIFMPVNNI